jgi:hypothetical protein
LLTLLCHVLPITALLPPCQVSRKLRKVKERLISQGTWPGKGGPRVNTDEEEFKVGDACSILLFSCR